MANKDIKGSHLISESLWKQIEPLLPPEIPKPKGGRPRVDNRKAMEAILYVLHTDFRWSSLPRSMGSSSTVRRRLQEWQKYGVFQRMWRAGILTYDELRTLLWHGKNR